MSPGSARTTGYHNRPQPGVRGGGGGGVAGGGGGGGGGGFSVDLVVCTPWCVCAFRVTDWVSATHSAPRRCQCSACYILLYTIPAPPSPVCAPISWVPAGVCVCMCVCVCAGLCVWEIRLHGLLPGSSRRYGPGIHTTHSLLAQRHLSAHTGGTSRCSRECPPRRDSGTGTGTGTVGLGERCGGGWWRTVSFVSGERISWLTDWFVNSAVTEMWQRVTGTGVTRNSGATVTEQWWYDHVEVIQQWKLI